MPHIPRRSPLLETPRSISVTPEGGRLALIFKLGIRTAMEQSKVPLVLNRMIVGKPALATLFLGKYPPLAVISIICLPSITLALSAGILFSALEFPSARIIAPPIRKPARIIDIAVAFIKIILLKIKDWWNKADNHKAVNKIKQGKHDHDKSGRFEENSGLGIVFDAKRTKTNKREHG